MQADELLSLMQSHTGRANAIHSAQLAIKAGIGTRVVRKLVTELRFQGHAVVGTPTTGYYLADCEKDVKEFEHFNRRRALTTLAHVACVMRISVPQLLGQLLLLESNPT